MIDIYTIVCAILPLPHNQAAKKWLGMFELYSLNNATWASEGTDFIF